MRCAAVLLKSFLGRWSMPRLALLGVFATRTNQKGRTANCGKNFNAAESSVTTSPSLRLPPGVTNWTSYSLVGACLRLQWENSATFLNSFSFSLKPGRVNDIGPASDAQFCFCFLPWKPFWLTQCRLHGAIQKQLSCQVEESRGGSSFKCSAYASVLRESGAQRTMNKDLRMARKGLPMGFRHGRRHSCLGYVPNLCILWLFFFSPLVFMRGS